MAIDDSNDIDSQWVRAEIKIPQCLQEFQVKSIFLFVCFYIPCFVLGTFEEFYRKTR